MIIESVAWAWTAQPPGFSMAEPLIPTIS